MTGQLQRLVGHFVPFSSQVPHMLNATIIPTNNDADAVVRLDTHIRTSRSLKPLFGMICE